jgi:hypothetical protein
MGLKTAFHTKKEAQKAGEELLSKLKGKGWRIKVWSNLGWHYNLANGRLTIHPDSFNKGYMALLSDATCKHIGGGAAFWTNSKSFKDPNDAVKDQIKRAKSFVSQFSTENSKMLSELSERVEYED